MTKVLCILLPLVALASCDQHVDPGRLDQGGSAAGDLGPSPDGTASDNATRQTVFVSHQGVSETVPLGSLPPMVIGGAAHARLSDVVKQAFPTLKPEAIVADFLATDGFQPGQMDFCKPLVPVPGDLLSRGYIEQQTRRLAWDESLKYPGCMSPLDVAEILLDDR